jgi:hypothetical protein
VGVMIARVYTPHPDPLARIDPPHAGRVKRTSRHRHAPLSPSGTLCPAPKLLAGGDPELVFHHRHARFSPSGHCQRAGKTGGRGRAHLCCFMRSFGRSPFVTRKAKSLAFRPLRGPFLTCPKSRPVTAPRSPSFRGSTPRLLRMPRVSICARPKHAGLSSPSLWLRAFVTRKAKSLAFRPLCGPFFTPHMPMVTTPWGVTAALPDLSSGSGSVRAMRRVCGGWKGRGQERSSGWWRLNAFSGLAQTSGGLHPRFVGTESVLFHARHTCTGFDFFKGRGMDPRVKP